MQDAQVYSSIQNLTEAYCTHLKALTAAQFQQTPPIGGWSYSEVYAHIFDSSNLSLQAMEKCLEGLGKDRPTNFSAKLILFMGMLPPGIKYKVPKVLAERVKVISISEAEELIQQFKEQLDKDYKKMSRARIDLKTAHPVLGFLNAKQWLRFIEIHLKHHLKQLKRIEKSF
jgi:hypothetical protein